MKSTFKKQMFVQAKNLDLNAGQVSSSSSPSSSSAPASTSSSNNLNPQSFIDPATYMCNGEFVFRIPPEAPVFEPTVEEFLDPLAYINKIRPVAEKTGICKVKPPPEWHPPFAVDVDHFKFTPRIQKLNELDANTRVKLYFLDRLATYWNYSGVQIRIPAIDDKTVDMYSLYKVVELEGGFETVNAEKKWMKVASRMGYVNEKIVAPQLRQHYKRLLLPYEKFEKMKNMRENGITNANVKKETKSGNEGNADSSPEKSDVKVEPNNSSVGSNNNSGCGHTANANSNNSNSNKSSNTLRRCTRSTCDEHDTEILVSDTFKNPIIQDKNKELQRLTFYGPGPKILGSNKLKSVMQQQSQQQRQPHQNHQSKKQETSPATTTAAGTAGAAATTPVTVNDDLLADSACMVCGNGDSEECILLCDGCDDGYHTFCLIPPLNAIPKGEWRCPKCIAAVVSKASDTTFGFEQAEREYSLQQFGEMADQFKSNYFNMPVHLVPTERVEQEYWKILSSMDSCVTVEYGADLHSMDHGSGFPTQMALKQSGDENHYYKSYVESSWNLNNIPVLEGSVLGYINADISGMKIPWMYVGMCFSTFCWHNEDHWSYSINYLHWGEPKTWYGVPGFMAERFEEVMQETTPDLFRNQPDLLHQLVTILNPNILMDRGVPVYHIDQAAGEFVLTFPRAYHAGFNHGYNFAEAVNFAPVDWIPLGRECVEHYSSLHRYCVFSHDELICKMASVPEKLNSKLATATLQDMRKMLDFENKQRKALLGWGVMNAEREAFELLADDERKCAECNTTCFLSAVTCACSPKKVTCLRHFREHCSCPPIEHTLRYRYTLDELPVMFARLKIKAESVATWATKVQDALDIKTPRTITLSGLKELLYEAREKHFPDDLSLNLLSKAIKSVQDALAVDFKNILFHKQTLNKKVTLMEIRCYYEELQRIPCILPQENTVKHFLKFLEEFQENADRLLKNENATVRDVESLLKQGHFPNVEVPLIETLKDYKKVLCMIEEYEEKCKKPSVLLTPDIIEKLLTCCKGINNPNARVTAISKHLTTLKEKILSWEAKVKSFVSNEMTVAGAKKRNDASGDAEVNVKIADDDNASAADANPSTLTKYPLSKLESFLEEGNGIDAFLPSREKLYDLTQRASTWKNRAINLLIQKRSPPVLFELLERLIDEGESIPVELEEMAQLKCVAEKVSQWKDEVHQLFMGDCKVFSLLEVLMPRKNLQRICRYKSGVEGEEKEKKLTNTSTTPEHFDLFGAADLNAGKEEFDLEKIVSSFKVAEKREFELMRALRVKNTYKKKQGDGSFCICKNSSATSMKECILCKDLFHEICLKQLANYWEDRRQNSRIFLCPFCQRSKRPSSKSVANALVKLQKLQMRTLEGIAMQCLIERETKWKEAVNELLKTPELLTLSQNTTEPKSKASITLSNENRNSLESLLFRGFLLELDLPENEIIYKILHRLDAMSEVVSTNLSYDPTKCQSQSPNFDQMKVDMELSNETCSLKNELAAGFVLQPAADGDKKRKYSDISTENIENDEIQAIRGGFDKIISPLSVEKSKNDAIRANLAMRKRNRKNNAFALRMKQSPGFRNGVERKREIILAKSLQYEKNTNPSATSSSSYVFLQNDMNGKSKLRETIEIEDEEEEVGAGTGVEEEEIECDAKRCVKPSGEHVDWVQCDYCKNWLHMVCIGVTKREVDNQTEFMCSLCKNVDSSKNKEDNMDDDDDDVVFVEYASNNAALCSS